MAERRRYYHSHLYTVRLWLEDLGDGRVEWRGQVEHVMSGERRYFRSWPSLLEQLKELLPSVNSPPD